MSHDTPPEMYPSSVARHYEDENPDAFIYRDGGLYKFDYQMAGERGFDKPVRHDEKTETELTEAEQQKVHAMAEDMSESKVPSFAGVRSEVLNQAVMEEIKRRLSQPNLAHIGVGITKDGEALSINLYQQNIHDKEKSIRYTFEASKDEFMKDEQLKDVVYQNCVEQILSGKEGWQYLSKNLAMLNMFGVLEKLNHNSEVKHAIALHIAEDLRKAEDAYHLHGDDRIFLHLEEPGLKELLESTDVRYSDEVKEAWKDYIVSMFRKDIENKDDATISSIEVQAKYFGYNTVAGNPEIRQVAKEYFANVLEDRENIHRPAARSILRGDNLHRNVFKELLIDDLIPEVHEVD